MVLYDPAAAAKAWREMTERCAARTTVYDLIMDGHRDANVVEFAQAADYLRGRRLFFPKDGG